MGLNVTFRRTDPNVFPFLIFLTRSSSLPSLNGKRKSSVLYEERKPNNQNKYDEKEKQNSFNIYLLREIQVGQINGSFSQELIRGN